MPYSPAARTRGSSQVQPQTPEEDTPSKEPLTDDQKIEQGLEKIFGKPSVNVQDANQADKSQVGDANTVPITKTEEKARPFSKVISTEMQTRALSDKVGKIECILNSMKQAVSDQL